MMHASGGFGSPTDRNAQTGLQNAASGDGSALRLFGAISQNHGTLTIPQFSHLLSSSFLDRVIGAPGINNNLIELFLNIAHSADNIQRYISFSTRIAQGRAGEGFSLDSSELHLYFSRSLPIPSIRINTPDRPRSWTLNLTGTAPGAESIAIISDSIAIRVPVMSNGSFTGVLPLLSNQQPRVAAYSLNYTRRIKSALVYPSISELPNDRRELPAFDLLGILDDIKQQIGPEVSSTESYSQLKGAAIVELTGALANTETCQVVQSLIESQNLTPSQIQVINTLAHR